MTEPMPLSWDTYRALAGIAKERGRQDAKWGEQNHPLISSGLVGVDPQDAAMRAAIWYAVPTAHQARTACQANGPTEDDNWAAILLEEFCEFLEAAALGDEPGARQELVQLGAVAAAAIEAMDRRKA